jgi:hypothetical protein
MPRRVDCLRHVDGLLRGNQGVQMSICGRRPQRIGERHGRAQQTGADRTDEVLGGRGTESERLKELAVLLSAQERGAGHAHDEPPFGQKGCL